MDSDSWKEAHLVNSRRESSIQQSGDLDKLKQALALLLEQDEAISQEIKAIQFSPYYTSDHTHKAYEKSRQVLKEYLEIQRQIDELEK